MGEVEQVFPKRLAQAREHAGSTMQQLAEQTGIGVASISRYENGEYAPRIGTLETLSEVLNVRMGWLLGEL